MPTVDAAVLHAVAKLQNIVAGTPRLGVMSVGQRQPTTTDDIAKGIAKNELKAAADGVSHTPGKTQSTSEIGIKRIPMRL